MQEGKNYTSYLTMFSMDFKSIWYAAETCWSDEQLAHFIFFNQYLWERTLLMWLCQKSINSGWHLDIYRPISFRLSMIETTELYTFDTTLGGFDLHSGSQLLRSGIVLCSFSHKMFYWFWRNQTCCHKLLIGWSSCLICFTRLAFKGENSTFVIICEIHL